MNNTVKTHTFDPPILVCGPAVSQMDVVEIDDGLYDLFDQNGTCWNEGCPFPFIPTDDEVMELLTTGRIAGKIE